jgi:5-methylcytosine-specific restriction endonuclease McrA
MKRCSKCSIEKETENFFRNRAMSDGLDHYCKACRKELKSTPYWKTKTMEYDSNSKGQARSRKYNQTPKGRATQKRRRDTYRSTDNGRAVNRRHKLLHYYRDPEYHKAKARARFHKMPLELLEKVRLRDEVCQGCGTGQNLQFDHIHPTRFGGKSTEENLQLLCGSCNGFKSDNLVLPDGGMMRSAKHRRRNE